MTLELGISLSLDCRYGDGTGHRETAVWGDRVLVAMVTGVMDRARDTQLVCFPPRGR